LIPAGTGFAHHAERRRTRQQDLADQLKELDDAATAAALAEAAAEAAAEAESEAKSETGIEAGIEDSNVADKDSAEVAVAAEAAEVGVAAEGGEEATTDA
jgi:hypothetical protein